MDLVKLVKEATPIKAAKFLKSHGLHPADLPDEISKSTVILIACHYFLESIDNKLTRNKYSKVIEHFIHFCWNTRKASLLDVTGLDLLYWREDLEKTGGVAGSNSDEDLSVYIPNDIATIENKTSVISSFYSFLKRPGLFKNTQLITFNPVDSLKRNKIEKYGKSIKTDLVSFKQILKSIDKSNLNGIRDYILFLGFYLTGRRFSEWVNLKWGDINKNVSPPTFLCRRKGGKVSNLIIPSKIWVILKGYVDKKWGSQVNKNTYIFSVDGKAPLSESSVLQKLKKLAAAVNLDPNHINIHSLRHLHAETALSTGANIEQIRGSLQHDSLNTTQVYASKMKEETNRLADNLEKSVLNTERSNG